MTTLTATNPRTGIADYRCPATSRDELAALAGRLRRGQASWAKLSVRDRGQAPGVRRDPENSRGVRSQEAMGGNDDAGEWRTRSSSLLVPGRR